MERKTKRRLVFLGAFTFVLAAAGWLVGQVTLSALPEPGRAETYFATKGKRWLIARAARELALQPAANSPQMVTIGEMQYRARCASCHGLDGRTPAETGRWMYPRASDLGSPEVQRYSDTELFWVIQNGVRLTGMPGFGKVMSHEEIWPLVYYLRRLASPSSP